MSKPVFNVYDYGAKGDGEAYDTEALTKAISACAGTGGTVYLPKGGRFKSSQLELKSDMTFYIEKGAVLLGGTSPEDYPVLLPITEYGMKTRTFQDCQRGLVYAYKADNLIVTGGGTIDGQGQHIEMTGREGNRPLLMRYFRCHNLRISDLTLRNSRMWVQVYDQCDGLLIEKLYVNSPSIYRNHDGLDVCDSSNVMIRDNVIVSEDDSIVLKSMCPIGLKNVTIINNKILNHRANGIKIGTDTQGPITNIKIIDNEIYQTRLGGICLESVDGSALSNVTVKNLLLVNTGQPIYIRLGSRDRGKLGVGSINNLTLDNIRVIGTRRTGGSTICGIQGHNIENVTLKNMVVEMPGGLDAIPEHPEEHDRGYPQSSQFGDTPAYGFYIRHARNIKFENVTIGYREKDARPWYEKNDATVTIENCEDKKLIKGSPTPKFPYSYRVKIKDSSSPKWLSTSTTLENWTTSTPKYPQWLLIDLKEVTDFSRLKLNTDHRQKGEINTFDIEVSSDGKIWSNVDLKNKPQTNGKWTETEFNKLQARYIRIDLKLP